MTGRTHDLAAFTALTVMAITTPWPTMTVGTAIVAVVANLLGGIAPDIDEPTAPFWRNLPVGHYVGKIFSAVAGGHRFILHSAFGLFLTGILLRWFLDFLNPSWPALNSSVVWWSFMVGYASHLVMDTFTKEGVPWLLPIPFKFGIPPIRAWRVTTDSWVENLIVFPGLLALEVYLIVTNYTQIATLVHQLGK